MLYELNHVLDYIEEHLTEELRLSAISACTGVSDYHVRKIFSFVSGMSLAEYVKNRRLAAANMELLDGARVTDVAFKYGYESVDGFTRAFKAWSGFLPSDAAKKGLCKSFPKFQFVINIKGGVSMDFRIEEKPALYLAGVSRRVPLQFEGVNNAIVELAMGITQEQRLEMHALQNIAPKEVINASWDSDTDFLREEGTLTHLIGVLTTDGSESGLLEKVPIPAHTWAVFPNEGPFPATLQNTMANIYAQWLPSSGYELIQAPSFSFTKMDSEKKDYAYAEVWVPVRRK